MVPKLRVRFKKPNSIGSVGNSKKWTGAFFFTQAELNRQDAANSLRSCFRMNSVPLI
jgi:hypothetical protein